MGIVWSDSAPYSVLPQVHVSALDRTTDVVAVLGMLLDKGVPLDAIQYAHHPGSLNMY
jgi:hypothetical protein